MAAVLIDSPELVNLYDLNTHVILPVTEPRGCAMVEVSPRLGLSYASSDWQVLAQQDQLPDYFVSQ